MAALTQSLSDILLTPFTRPFNMGEQTFWLSYAGAIIVASLYFLCSRRSKYTNLPRLWRYLFPRHILRHPSTVLDIKLYFFGSVFMALQTALVFAQLDFSGNYISTTLNAYFPQSRPSSIPLIVVIFTPIALLLAYELGYWLAHYLMHNVPFLWEFHKIHHNAEVMTPLTEMRQHPVDFFVFPLVIGIIMSVAYGVLRWQYGKDLPFLPFWNVAIILFMFNMTIGHLRHSHVKMAAPRWLAHLVHTPAHHHIHHSVEERHFNKNLGYCLTMWDWAFGTLYLPEKRQRIRFGLSSDNQTVSHGFWHQMIDPFQTIWKSFRKTAQPHASRDSISSGQ